jgi:hypothetical protein
MFGMSSPVISLRLFLRLTDSSYSLGLKSLMIVVLFGFLGIGHMYPKRRLSGLLILLAGLFLYLIVLSYVSYVILYRPLILVIQPRPFFIFKF